MKNQALFSLKDKSRELKCRLLQFLFGALRVKKSVQPQWSNMIISQILVKTAMTNQHKFAILKPKYM